MYLKSNVLCVIPARGGSKGLVGKNLRMLGPRTLVEWALNSARSSPLFDRIIVSSDSQEIIDTVNKHGDYAPFIRPSELAQDNSPSLPVFKHALDWAEKEDMKFYDYIVVLEPTAPFRLPKHIEQGLKLLEQKQATSVVSLVKVGDHHPIRIKKLASDGKLRPFCIDEPEGLRRQDQEDAYIKNGAIYIFKNSILKSNKMFGDDPYGFEMDKDLYSINIDEPADLFYALHLYNKLKDNSSLHKIEQ